MPDHDKSSALIFTHIKQVGLWYTRLCYLVQFSCRKRPFSSCSACWSKAIFSSGMNRKKGNSWKLKALRKRVSCQFSSLDSCLGVLLGIFSLPSNLFMLLTNFYGLVLKLWQRDTNWRLLARRPMGIVVSFVFRSMRLKIVLKFPASGFLLGDFFAMVICSEICKRLSCYYAWCLLFAGIYLVLKYLRF